MNEILKPGQTVRTESSRIACTVEKFLGAGGQGEVYGSISLLQKHQAVS